VGPAMAGVAMGGVAGTLASGGWVADGVAEGVLVGGEKGVSTSTMVRPHGQNQVRAG
jgi:hypothetical protein